MNVTAYDRLNQKFNGNHRKENRFYREESVVGLDKDGKIIQPVIARFYGTNARIYCCLWIHGEPYTSGSGYADGGGYHKPSAALQKAITNAGFTLSESIHGRGDTAIDAALLAIADYVSRITSARIIRAHA